MHAVAIDGVPEPAVLALVRSPAANPAVDAFLAYAAEAFGVPAGT